MLSSIPASPAWLLLPVMAAAERSRKAQSAEALAATDPRGEFGIYEACVDAAGCRGMNTGCRIIPLELGAKPIDSLAPDGASMPGPEASCIMKLVVAPDIKATAGAMTWRRCDQQACASGLPCYAQRVAAIFQGDRSNVFT